MQDVGTAAMAWKHGQELHDGPSVGRGQASLAAASLVPSIASHLKSAATSDYSNLACAYYALERLGCLGGSKDHDSGSSSGISNGTSDGDVLQLLGTLRTGAGFLSSTGASRCVAIIAWMWQRVSLAVETDMRSPSATVSSSST